MADIEKVIKSIEGCVLHKIDCVDCDYDGCVFAHGDCKRDLLADALELLKEQQAVIECLKRKVKQFEHEKSWDECPDRMNGGGWT